MWYSVVHVWYSKREKRSSFWMYFVAILENVLVFPSPILAIRPNASVVRSRKLQEWKISYSINVLVQTLIFTLLLCNIYVPNAAVWCSLISANHAQTLSVLKNHLVLISVNLWIRSDRSEVISNYKDDSNFASILKYTVINPSISSPDTLSPQGLCDNHSFLQPASSFSEAD